MKIKFFDPTRELKARKKEIDRKVKEIYSSGNFASGKNVIEFEEKFADYCGVKYCCAVSSGTSALEIAIRFFREEISNGKNVWTSPNTFSATSEAIVSNRLNPRFVDTDNTANLSIDKLLQEDVTPKDLILPISLYSNPFDIVTLRKKYPKNFIILDQCQAVGCEINGQKIDKYADVACYSFYPTKVLGAAFGEGGAIVTNNEELYKFAKSVSFHGQTNKYIHNRVGTNARMVELVAASLIIKLKYLEETIQHRIDMANLYSKGLKNISDFKFIEIKKNYKCPYYVFPVYIPNREMENATERFNNIELKEKLKTYDIECSFHYPLSLHKQKAYETYQKSLPFAEKQFSTQLSIPLYYGITTSEINYAIDKIRYVS